MNAKNPPRNVLVEIALRAEKLWLAASAGLVLLDTALSIGELILLYRIGTDWGNISNLAAIGAGSVALALGRMLCWSSILFARDMWYRDLLYSLLHVGARNVSNRPDLYSDRQLRSERHNIPVSSGYLTLGNLVNFSVEMTRAAALFLTSLVALGVLFGFSITVPFLVSAVVGWVINSKVYQPIKKRSSAEELARVEMTKVYGDSWDLVVPGNPGSWNRWLVSFDSVFSTYRDKTRDRAAVSTAVQLIQYAIAYGLVVGVVWAGIFGFINICTSPLSLLTSVPKIVQVLQQQSAFLSYLSVAGVLAGKLNTLRSGVELPVQRDLLNRIDQSAIKISPFGRGGRTSVDLVEFLSSREEGRATRICVRGRNGSGKSSLLLVLKQCLGERAAFLPAVFPSSDGAGPTGCSTGEHHFAALKGIVEDPSGATVLLLDEWDAHLDDGRKDAAEALLAEAVDRGVTIVEVRHKSDAPNMDGFVHGEEPILV